MDAPEAPQAAGEGAVLLDLQGNLIKVLLPAGHSLALQALGLVDEFALEELVQPDLACTRTACRVAAERTSDSLGGSSQLTVGMSGARSELQQRGSDRECRVGLHNSKSRTCNSRPH